MRLPRDFLIAYYYNSFSPVVLPARRVIKNIGFRARQTLVQNLALPLTCYEELASYIPCLSLFFLSVKLDNRGAHQPRHRINAITGKMLPIMSREGAIESLVLDGAAQSRSLPRHIALVWKETVHQLSRISLPNLSYQLPS